MRRWAKIAMMVTVGGTLLQATTSCQDTVAPLLVNLITSVVLQSLVGGFAT